jgi:hypothetical protein
LQRTAKQDGTWSSRLRCVEVVVSAKACVQGLKRVPRKSSAVSSDVVEGEEQKIGFFAIFRPAK